jgi:hypothetical protein
MESVRSCTLLLAESFSQRLEPVLPQSVVFRFGEKLVLDPVLFL